MGAELAPALAFDKNDNRLGITLAGAWLLGADLLVPDPELIELRCAPANAGRKDSASRSSAIEGGHYRVGTN